MRKGFTLLLVEDDPVLGPITAEALEMFGHATTVAATLGAAMTALHANTFDAIILDLELRGERGEHLVFRLRKEGLRIPDVVILSAQPKDILLRVQRELDACGALQKPASPEELIAELQRCIPTR